MSAGSGCKIHARPTLEIKQATKTTQRQQIEQLRLRANFISLVVIKLIKKKKKNDHKSWAISALCNVAGWKLKNPPVRSGGWCLEGQGAEWTVTHVKPQWSIPLASSYSTGGISFLWRRLRRIRIQTENCISYSHITSALHHQTKS